MRWPWIFGLLVIFGATAGMGSCGTPTGPTYNVSGNNGPVTITPGTNSAGGTAPCAATTVPNGSAGCPTTNNTTNNNNAP